MHGSLYPKQKTTAWLQMTVDQVNHTPRKDTLWQGKEHAQQRTKEGRKEGRAQNPDYRSTYHLGKHRNTHYYYYSENLYVMPPQGDK